jgi:alanyl-tRNA synthetase
MTYSIELCGGTHVRRPAISGSLLLGDSASSAGVRRIEALTGKEALNHLERAGGPGGRDRGRAEGAAGRAPER